MNQIMEHSRHSLAGVFTEKTQDIVPEVIALLTRFAEQSADARGCLRLRPKRKKSTTIFSSAVCGS